MEKTLIIDGKSVTFRCSGGFLIRYKEMTCRDPIQDIVGLSKITSKDGVDYSKLDTHILYDILWVLARSADPDVPDLLTWLDSFDSFPIGEVFPQIIDVLTAAFGTTVEPKTPSKKRHVKYNR